MPENNPSAASDDPAREIRNLVGEGIVIALSIITASLATRTGITSVVREDLALALEGLRRAQPSAGLQHRAAQHVLGEAISLLTEFETRPRPPTRRE